MQEVEKEKILELWKQGFGSSRIAKTLGLNTNTVKTFCRRNGLTKVTVQKLWHFYYSKAWG